MFAPPTAVPGAAAFPTSPVSPDAVLLTTARILDRVTPGRAWPGTCWNGVVGELTRRGVRAIELFGREGMPDPEGERAAGRKRHRKLRAEPSVGRSGADAVAREAEGSEGAAAPTGRTALSRSACCRRRSPGRSGFEEVAPHHRYPRLRYELAPGHRLEGGGRGGAGEAVHRDHRAGLAVTAGPGAGRHALSRFVQPAGALALGAIDRRRRGSGGVADRALVGEQVGER